MLLIHRFSFPITYSYFFLLQQSKNLTSKYTEHTTQTYKNWSIIGKAKQTTWLLPSSKQYFLWPQTNSTTVDYNKPECECECLWWYHCKDFNKSNASLIYTHASIISSLTLTVKMKDKTMKQIIWIWICKTKQRTHIFRRYKKMFLSATAKLYIHTSVTVKMYS